MTYLRYLSEENLVLPNMARTAHTGKPRANYGKFLKHITVTLDFIVLNACFGIAVNLFPAYSLPSWSAFASFLIVFNILWGVLAFTFKRHQEANNAFALQQVLANTLKITFVHFLVISAMVQFTPYFAVESYLLPTYGLLLVLQSGTRFGLFYALLQYRKLGYNYKNAVIVGTGASGIKLYEHLIKDASSGLKFKGLFSDEDGDVLKFDQFRGGINELESFCQKNNIGEIFCALPASDADKIEQIMSIADNNLIRLKLVPDFGSLSNKNINVNFYNNIPVISPRHEPLEILSNRALKRGFDIVFSAAVISIIFPFLFPLLAVLIKLGSKGPVFFKQLRTGKDNRSFYCYKFRTMQVNNDSDKVQAKKNDDRTTKIGNFLRKTNLDELPQFFNVLQGDMSVVGPRPHMLLHTEEYSKIIDRYMARHFVKPGITGWAQVNGYRGNTEDPELMKKRVEHDVWYLENWNLWLDIKIIFLTGYNMLKGEENAF